MISDNCKKLHKIKGKLYYILYYLEGLEAVILNLVNNFSCFWNSATKDFIQPFLLMASGIVSLWRLKLFL